MSAIYDVNGNEIINSSDSSTPSLTDISPVPLATVNAMLMCAYTYIDACRSGNLVYGDGTGSSQSEGTISCSTFARCLLQGIPYSDYRPKNATSTSLSGKRWRYGYQMIGEDYYASNATATAQQMYDTFYADGRAFPTDYNFEGVMPGDFIVFGTSLTTVRHIGMYVYKDAVGNHYIMDSNILSRNGTPAIRVHVAYDHSSEASNNPVGVIRPNLTEADLPIDKIDLAVSEGSLTSSITGQILNGYLHILTLSGDVTSGASVAYGDITFTAKNTGDDFRVIPIVSTSDTTAVLTVAGVSNLSCTMSHYIDSRTYGGSSEGSGSAVATDKTLTIENSPADAKTVGDELYDSEPLTGGWSVGGINSSTGANVSATNRLKSPKLSVLGVTADSEYSFYVCCYDGGTYAGAIRTTGAVATSGTLAWLKTIDLSSYSEYTFKFILKKDDDSVLTVADASVVKFWHIHRKYYPVIGGDLDLDFKTSVDRNLCLCALKTDILDSKIPFHSGYLFHKFANDDGTLFYGDDLEHIKRIGQLAFTPKDYVLAMSPTDGRVIAAKRDQRTSLMVWDGEKTIPVLSSASVKPQGWLYNSGVDFIIDGNGLEHCVFAEYNGNGGDGFYVWHGTYPYTSDSDWEHVMYLAFSIQSSAPDAITHFHQIRRDPWTDILYLTSGDRDWQLKWWYSTDYGQTWTLLTDNSTNGWENGTGRVINFVFTSDYVYWATDSQGSHTLNRIERDSTTGVLDPTTRYKICDLPSGRATNSICYLDSPRGLFMYDRCGDGTGSQGFDLQYYDLRTSELITIMHINLVSGNSWGGHRGKCYVNYTSGAQPYPAMGFAGNTPCIFDVAYPDVSKIGTVYYDVISEIMKFVEWR